MGLPDIISPPGPLSSRKGHDGWLSKVLGSRMNQEVKTRLWVLWLGVLATLMLIYASLIPLQYRPLDWHETIERWKNISWSPLGGYIQTDWIAHCLTVIPPGFLLTGALRYRRGDRKGIEWLIDLGASALVLVFLVVLVLGIELAQVWFPPRNLSRNDILAGWIGALAGILFWHVSGRWLIGTFDRLVSKNTVDDRLKIGVGLICLASIFHTFSPFDFILNWVEIKNKLAMERIEWIPNFRSVFDFWSWKGVINESIKMVFWGVWIGLYEQNKRPVLKLFCVVLLMELVQIPIYSRHFSLSQIVFGLLAAVAGLLITKSRKRWGVTLWIPSFWIVVSVLWAILLFFSLTLGYDRISTDLPEIFERFKGFFTPPFSRYYYTSEFRAASSILGKSMLYGGFGMTLGMIGVTSAFFRGNPFKSIALASIVILALAIEVTQIFLPPLYSDSTDLLIATLSGIIGFKCIQYIMTPTMDLKI
jgi:VanZ family protein